MAFGGGGGGDYLGEGGEGLKQRQGNEGRPGGGHAGSFLGIHILPLLFPFPTISFLRPPLIQTQPCVSSSVAVFLASFSILRFFSWRSLSSTPIYRAGRGVGGVGMQAGVTQNGEWSD